MMASTVKNGIDRLRNGNQRRRRGRTLVGNVFIFYLRISQLCKSVQYAYRPNNLLRLNVYPNLSIAFSLKRRYKKLVRVLQKTRKLVISRCCFEENVKEMYQDSKRTYTAIVLLFCLATLSSPSTNTVLSEQRELRRLMFQKSISYL